jgi:hypothetical protein
MNKQLLWVMTWIIAATVSLLAGCSTTVRATKKLEGYDQKISVAGVVWMNNANLQTQIRKTAHASIAAITEANKTQSRENLTQILQLLASKVTYAASAKLNSNGVTATALANNTSYYPNEAKHLIRIHPDAGMSECSGLSCSHDIGLTISVVDIALKKSVWQGAFKVGPPLGGPVTDQLLDSFVSSLISELKTAKLL